MKTLLIGANGQLGQDLVRVYTGENLISLTHRDIEICVPASIDAVFSLHRPDVVINTAAFVRVDDCETATEQAFRINASGAHNLALACRTYNCTLLHLSTDYVFDGRRTTPYSEEDSPNPINAYGVSKLAGEYCIRYVLERSFIVRSSGLYGRAGSRGKGGNFVETMLQLARGGGEIRVVHDQVLTPTYTYDLAVQIKRLLTTTHYGLYHATNQGACSWFEFAAMIFRLSGLNPVLIPISSATLGAPARRPAYSVLDNTRLRALGLDCMPPWQDALARYLQEREHHASLPR